MAVSVRWGRPGRGGTQQGTDATELRPEKPRRWSILLYVFYHKFKTQNSLALWFAKIRFTGAGSCLWVGKLV